MPANLPARCPCCSSNPRLINSTRWQRVRAGIIANRTSDLCAECGQPIDFNAKGRTPRSPSVDHRVPRSLGGCMWDTTNMRVVHYGCNARKKDKLAGKRIVRSQAW